MQRSQKKPGIAKTMLAIVFYNPLGRFLTYILGLGLMMGILIILTGNNFESFYFYFGLIILAFAILNWVSYALDLERSGRENEAQKTKTQKSRDAKDAKL